MVAKRYIALCLLVLLGFMGCKERFDGIILEPQLPDEQFVIDSTYMSSQLPPVQDKNVLIEDFTGIQCPNCPKAQSEIVKIEAAHPGRVVAIGLHPQDNVFTDPLPASKFDFRTAAAKQLLAELGTANGLPTGAVDRVRHGDNRFSIFPLWGGYVNERLNESSPVVIAHTQSYDTTSRLLSVTFDITYLEDMAAPQAFTVALTESGIIDIQQTTTGFIQDYTHNHVLRWMSLPYNGLLLPGPVQRGKAYVIKLITKLDESWDPHHLHIVGFIHNKDLQSAESNFEVQQVVQFDVE